MYVKITAHPDDHLFIRCFLRDHLQDRIESMAVQIGGFETRMIIEFDSQAANLDRTLTLLSLRFNLIELKSRDHGHC